jgi:hypothetical protein
MSQKPRAARAKQTPSSPLDPERHAIIERAQRAQQCEAEVAALLARHRCALQAVQTWVNGQPQPIVIRVVPLDVPPPQAGLDQPPPVDESPAGPSQ